MKKSVARKRIVGLDALRFVAIVMVVVYHCFPGILPGGFIAVELFFGLSGFLMGQKLLREYRTKGVRFGGFSGFWSFVWGRLVRFLPTLLFCVILTLSLAYFADPDLLTAARPNTLFAMTFSTNIASIVNGSTYESSLIPNLFNQTWFLALELQVCVIFYLMMVVVAKLSPMKKGETKKFYRRFLGLCLGVAVVSFALMAVYGGWFNLYDRAYFGLDSHVGAFFLGAAFAAFTMMHRIWPAKKGRRWGWLVLLFASVAGVVAMTPFIQYSSGLAFVMALPVTAVLGVVMVLAVLKLQRPVSKRVPRVLKVLEYLGGLSFAIYLLHWGLYIILPSLLSFWPHEVIPYVVIVASVLLSILLYRVIMPFSKKHKVIFGGLLICSMILPVMSLVKAPEKSSIEENLTEAKNALEEANQPAKGVTTAAVDYGGIKDLADLLGGDVMKFFDAAEGFAKPYPAAVRYGGATSLSGRAYYNTPDYNRTSELVSKRVMVLGDSVVLGATTAIYNTVPGVFVDALGSRNMVDAINLLAGYRAANGGTLPRVIVIGLITNYTNFGVGTLQAIMDAAGPGHQFVFITGYCKDAYSRASQNQTLVWMANNYGNVHVADWVPIADANASSYLYADRIHLTPAGRQAYANMVNQATSGL